MFHKRLMGEFRDNMKYVAGMVATQWMQLLANVALMLAIARTISAVSSKAVTMDELTKLGIVFVCVVLVRAVSACCHLCYGRIYIMSYKWRKILIDCIVIFMVY